MPPRARWRKPLVAAAAILAIAVGFSAIQWTGEPQLAEQDSRPSVPQGADDQLLIQPAASPRDAFASRPPTPFEQVAFLAMTSHGRPRPIAPAKEPESIEEGVKQLLSRTPPAGPRDLIALGGGKESYAVLLSQSKNERAVRLFLQSLTIESQRQTALAALLETKSPPTDGLFSLLQDDDRATRRLAALALGTRNGPEITRRLIDIVSQQNPRNAEAWLALDTCRGDLAHSFLAEASRQPKLLGYLNAARVRWSLPL
jgi:hypothetical protein